MPENYPSDLARCVRAQLARKFKSSCPHLAVLQKLFETLYFASLKREETENISCRIAFADRVNPDPDPPSRIVKDRWRAFALSQDLPLTVRNLVKLSKAVDPWSSTLAIDIGQSGELRIWGLIDQAVHHNTFVVQESDSGPEIPGIFQAVIEGVGEVAAYRGYTFLGRLRQDVLVTKELPALYQGPVHGNLYPAIQMFQNRVKSEVGSLEYERRGHWDASLSDDWLSALSRILIGIQRYGHGGAVLLSDVPDGLIPRYALNYPRLSDALHRCAVLSVQHTSYSDTIHEEYLDPDSDEESIPISLYLEERVSNYEVDETENEIKGSVRFLSSLSRVDGLIWLTPDLKLRGFGVLIGTEEEPPKVFRAENAQGTLITEVDIHSFGTRHRSMMRQCWKDPKSVGFVVSQDGDVRAITWHDGKILIWESVRLQRFLNTRSASSTLRTVNK